MEMTPLPGPLALSAPLVAWRVDASKHAATWDSGIGAQISGGRWNPKGVKVVYDIADDAYVDAERKLAAALARD